MEPRVTRVTESSELARDGRVRPVMRIEYMVGEHGPFMLSMPTDEYTPDAARMRMEEFARGIERLAR